MFTIYYTDVAVKNLLSLNSGQQKSAIKTIKLLAQDPRHISLETHKFKTLKGLKGEEVFEAYAGNNTPAALRVLWYYGPIGSAITILLIVPHSKL